MSQENNIGLRIAAHQARQQRPIGADLARPLNDLVDVECKNPKCGIHGVIYKAADLTDLLPKDSRSRNGHGPIVGPCVVCHEYTTEVIEGPKP